MEKADSMTITTTMHANGLDAVMSDAHAIDANDLSSTCVSCNSSDKEVGDVEGLVQSSSWGSDGLDVVVVPNDDDGGTDSDS